MMPKVIIVCPCSPHVRPIKNMSYIVLIGKVQMIALLTIYSNFLLFTLLHQILCYALIRKISFFLDLQTPNMMSKLKNSAIRTVSAYKKPKVDPLKPTLDLTIVLSLRILHENPNPDLLIKQRLEKIHRARTLCVKRSCSPTVPTPISRSHQNLVNLLEARLPECDHPLHRLAPNIGMISGKPGFPVSCSIYVNVN